VPALIFLLWRSVLLAQSPAGARDTYRPQIFLEETLRYRMVSGRTGVGEMTVTISHDEAAGKIYLVESVSGLFERSTVLTLRHDSALRPLASQTVFGREPRFHAVLVKYDETGLHGQIEQPAEFGGTHEINLALPPGTHDGFAVPHLMRARPLQLNEAISFPIFDFRQQRVDLARVWVVKNETVAVPAGDFVCHRMEGFSGKLRWIFFVDAEFPHRLVKQVFPGMEIEMDLVEWQATDSAVREAQKASSLKLH
jgi:hypothetical protein